MSTSLPWNLLVTEGWWHPGAAWKIFPVRPTPYFSSKKSQIIQNGQIGPNINLAVVWHFSFLFVSVFLFPWLNVYYWSAMCNVHLFSGAWKKWSVATHILNAMKLHHYFLNLTGFFTKTPWWRKEMCFSLLFPRWSGRSVDKVKCDLQVLWFSN